MDTPIKTDHPAPDDYVLGLANALGLRTDLARKALPVVLANLQTLDRKQQDYGSANLTKFGTLGVVVRMNDKLERAINLLKKEAQARNEPITDSFLDLANYAIIAYVMHAGIWPTPVKEVCSE